jgi:hypothetical protein
MTVTIQVKCGPGGVDGRPRGDFALPGAQRRRCRFSGTPVFRRLGDLYAARSLDIIALFNEGERTLIHGDTHSGNLFVDGGRTGFYDWAVAGRGPGVRDVAYFLCNSLPFETRRSHGISLLTRYRTKLATAGPGPGRSSRPGAHALSPSRRRPGWRRGHPHPRNSPPDRQHRRPVPRGTHARHRPGRWCAQPNPFPKRMTSVAAEPVSIMDRPPLTGR